MNNGENHLNKGGDLCSKKAMGRPTVQPGSCSIRHFSHPHPLQPSSNPHDRLSFCAACKLNLYGLKSYSCRACSFHLHEKCSELPQQIKHPFDQTHLLTLLPSPQYEEGRFKCDACGKNGEGFSYHCGDCGIDLHTVCANMPSSISHYSHPQHVLRLTFFIPDNSGSFCCRICQGIGSNSWLYRCNECRFNAHLICARKKNGQTSGVGSNPELNYIDHLNRSPPPPQVMATPVFPGQDLMRNVGPRNAATPTVNQFISHALRNVRRSSGFNHLMQGVDPGTLSGLDFSNFAQIDPSVFAGIDPSVLGDMFGGLGFY